MKDVILVVGTGPLGLAIARRIGAGRHVVLADLREETAKAALEQHQQRIAGKKMPSEPGHWEKCSHTEIRIPFKLDQPDADGIAVQFVDDTAKAFAGHADKFSGPFGVIDFNRNGNNSLFVLTRTNTFRTLLNTNGVFTPVGFEFPAIEGARYSRCLVGDLNNDGRNDLVVTDDNAIR